MAHTKVTCEAAYKNSLHGTAGSSRDCLFVPLECHRKEKGMFPAGEKENHNNYAASNTTLSMPCTYRDIAMSAT